MGSIKRVIRIVRLLRVAASRYGTNLPRALWHALRIVKVEGFRFSEAAFLGLLDPHLTRDERRAHLSQRDMRAIQDRLNPDEFRPLTDKAVFYRFCEELHVPTPALFALIPDTGSAWRAGGPPLRDARDWLSFLSETLPAEFVVKSSRLNGGEGVRVFRRAGDTFLDVGAGQACDAATLHEQLAAGAPGDTLIIQERVRSHPDIERVSGSEALQCLRLTTLVGPTTEVRLVHAYFRLISGTAVVDNVSDGAPGHLVAGVSLADGVLGPAATRSADGVGTALLENHPVTGRAIAGLRVPFWKESCALVCDVAPRFLPLRALGWDVALTATGPLLVETNWGWDPPNWVPGMPELLAALAEEEVRPTGGDHARS